MARIYTDGFSLILTKLHRARKTRWWRITQMLIMPSAWQVC